MPASIPLDARRRDDDVSVIIVAGGNATRLPGKLALDAGGLPLLVRVYRNVSPGRATIIAAPDIAPELAAAIDAPRIGEHGPKRGPLGGLLAAIDAVSTDWFFAVAGDAPFIDGAFIDRLVEARQSGDEAVVPRHPAGQVEPLASLYRTDAFRREGTIVLADSGALHRVIARLQSRYIEINDARLFANVNTPEDYAALRSSFDSS